MLKIKIKNHHFYCLPGKALFWEEENTLMLADVHLGKDSHFRKNGIAIPKVSQNDLLRMRKLLENHQPNTMLILGDLFHSYSREEYEGFRELVEAFPDTQFRYVAGNHDALALKKEDCPKNLWFGKEWEQREFRFVHYITEKSSETFTFQGHIHPQVQVKLNRNQWYKFPALVIQEDRATLPAFGRFTGGYKVKLDKKKERAVVFSGEECFEL